MRELRARSLTKHFSGVIAVKNVDFSLKSGEIVGYLGPNGSGKTTTLRMVAGLVDPSAGRVEYDGRNIRDDLIAFRHEFGYVPDMTALTSRCRVTRIAGPSCQRTTPVPRCQRSYIG